MSFCCCDHYPPCRPGECPAWRELYGRPVDFSKDKTVRHGLAIRASAYQPLILFQAEISSDRPLTEQYYDLMWHLALQWPGTVLLQHRISL